MKDCLIKNTSKPRVWREDYPLDHPGFAKRGKVKVNGFLFRDAHLRMKVKVDVRQQVSARTQNESLLFPRTFLSTAQVLSHKFFSATFAFLG